MNIKIFFLLAILGIVIIISNQNLINSQVLSAAANKHLDYESNWYMKGDACIFLIVDDDWDFDQTVENDGGRPYYTSALDLLGFVYDVWDTVSQGQPTAVNMGNYSAVIWFTGYDWQNTISPENETQLSSYLDGGGNLILSSEDYYAQTGSITPFMLTYLGIDSITNDKNEIDIIGNAANPIGNNLDLFTLVRPDDWATYWPTDPSEGPFTDYVSATSSASSPFRFSGSSKNNSTNKEDSGWKTVFLAWPFEWVDTVTERAAIMRNILDWTNPECIPIINYLPIITKNW